MSNKSSSKLKDSKQDVKDFWNSASCGEDLYLRSLDKSGYLSQMNTRYELEPFILSFADFNSSRGLKVLEIGVGLGADHQRFAEAGADLYGIDLTERAIEHTSNRLELFGLSSKLSVGDAESLQFPDNYFDIVYSWGVLHHSPNTVKALDEVFRVLKVGGEAKIMIYHKWSLVGLMLWLRYALLTCRPLRGLSTIYSDYLESPGTKAYSISEAKELISKFSDISLSTPLTHGDLLESEAGQRHTGKLLSIAKKIWPRWLLKKLFPNSGLFLMIKALK